MATYYLKLAADGGNDSLAGTSPSTAWATWAKALGATGITGGDILYVAPGVYNITSTVTVGGTYSSTAQIIGDVTSSQFPGMNPGVVVLTGWNAAKTTYSLGSNAVISGSGKSNLTFKSINFLVNSITIQIDFTTAQNIAFEDCIFNNGGRANALMRLSNTTGALNTSIRRCVFSGGANGLILIGNNVSDTSVMQSCLFTGFTNDPMTVTNCGVSVYNCTYINNRYGLSFTGVSASFPARVYNCMFTNQETGIYANVGSNTIEDFNRICNVATPRTNITTQGANTTTGTPNDLEFFQVYKSGLNFPTLFANTQNNINKNFGTSTNAPATDLFGVAWSGTTPDAGAITYNPINLVAPTLVYNGGNDRNASTITIAPGSTSQSIELYLGATGLTASTSGLSARYNRTRTASVSIPLVARTIAQAWTAGGFAEVDATNMPGVYRLDLPDAALAAGADDVTIVVRGASGTNGAVMTVKLSSGGLTSAQTASAVWDAATASYTANGTFGLNVLRADQQNKQGNVTLSTANNVNRVDADVHAIANDIAAATALKGALNHDGTGYIDSDIVRISTSTAAADELEGALLHNGADYISAELLTPVSAATSVHIGPYQLLADGLGADQPLDVNVGTATSIDVQVTDANGTGIDITGATVSAKVYNAGGTLVATYAGTATYADNGRLTFGLTTTVTNTSGTYTVTVTRTTGASDTQVFGPLKLYVRPV